MDFDLNLSKNLRGSLTCKNLSPFMMVKLVVEIWIQPTRRKGANFALRAVVLAHHATQTYLQWFEGFYTVFSGGTRVLQNMFETFHWKRN